MLSVAIGVYHTEVPNLGVVSDTFFLIGGYCCYQLLWGSITQRSQIWGWSVTLFSDRWLVLLSVAIGVYHTEVPNLWVVSDTFPFPFFVTLFGDCSYDGVSAAIGVQHRVLGEYWPFTQN